VEKTLNNITSLLEEGSRINEKYGERLMSNHPTFQRVEVFKTSFDRFKSRT